jgi:hypothetical protein
MGEFFQACRAFPTSVFSRLLGIALAPSATGAADGGAAESVKSMGPLESESRE